MTIEVRRNDPRPEQTTISWLLELINRTQFGRLRVACERGNSGEIRAVRRRMAAIFKAKHSPEVARQRH